MNRQRTPSAVKCGVSGELESLLNLHLIQLPVKNTSLRNAWMVKNCRFENVLELFRDDSAGSGQIELGQAQRVFGLSSPADPDLLLLRSVALLPAFDVFSLRLLLREMDVSLEHMEIFALSPQKTHIWDRQVSKLTLPLLEYVFGQGQGENVGLSHLVETFRNPNVSLAESQLSRLAKKLNIKVVALPSFLEDYADTFMAIAFYHVALTDLEPLVNRFLASVQQLSAEPRYRKNNQLRGLCAETDTTFQFILKMIGTRLMASEQLTAILWSNENTVPFQALQAKLREFHVLIALLVAGIEAKMSAWFSAFPVDESGKPQDRAEFLSNEISYAMSRLKHSAAHGTRSKKSPDVAQPPSSLPNTSLQQYLRNSQLH